jgi:hypothetical protein
MAKDPSTQERMERRVMGQMLTEAFFSIPSAILIGFSIIAFFLFPHIFEWWQPWFWIAFGALAELIYLGVTVTDPIANQEAARRALREKFDPMAIRNISARQRLQKALDYKTNIDAFVTKQSGAMRTNLANTADQINNWIELIFKLAKNIDAFESNRLIEDDRRTVPGELADLKRRMQAETDPSVKAEIQKAIDIRERLFNDLNTITNNVKRTDIAIDNTLAQLSTVYAQLQLLNTGSLNSGSVQRLNSEIQSEISALSDTVGAMNDVYSYKSYSVAAARLTTDDADTSSPTASSAENAAARGKSG